MTSKAKKPAAKSAEKPIKARKGMKADKPMRKPRAPAIFTVAKKWEGGVREAAQKALGSKGATIAQVQAKMKVPEHKVAGYLNWLAAQGFCKRARVTA